MIKLLHIENIAVIEKADVEFTPGLNVLTGETGAGKSIVIDALSAVTGGRTSRDVVRTGAATASVTAVFSGVDGALTDSFGIEPDESGELFVSRKISADGKNACRVNGAPVSASALRELGAALLDIHGQNDGRKLLDEGAHLSFLDAFGELDEMLGAFRSAYKKLKDVRAEIARLTMDEDEKARRIDMLKHTVWEIGQAQIRPGEIGELSSRRELLLNASKLTESVESAFEALFGGDETEGAVSLISNAQALLDRASRYSDALREIAGRLLDLRYSAQDIADELRDFRAELDFSPGELDELDERLSLLKRVTRKYGGESEALEQQDRCKAELSDIGEGESRLSKLEDELWSSVKEAVGISLSLSAKRKEAAVTLQNRVLEELSQLNMPGVSFIIEFGEVDGDNGLNGSGRDEVWFLMSANAGEAPGRINRIASGGELARIMLALKNVLTGSQDTGAMVFDEIDAGVSGVAAQRVGEKLAKLARRRQVLCVTHLPQIAAMADSHFQIQKSVSGGRTFTHVNKLDHEGRKKEIARLSGGENVTAAALLSAGEQLAAAEEFKKKM